MYISRQIFGDLVQVEEIKRDSGEFIPKIVLTSVYILFDTAPVVDEIVALLYGVFYGYTFFCVLPRALSVAMQNVQLVHNHEKNYTQ